MTEVYKLLDIQRLKTTPYHPQTNCQVERSNRSLKGMLASFVSDHQNNWDELLDPLCFAYNTSVHATTGFTPFESTYGRKPRLPIDLFYHALDGPDTVAICDEFSNGLHPLQRDLKISSMLYAHEMRETLQKTISIVNETSKNKHRISKIQYDRKVYKYMFEINDLVAVLD